MTLVGARPKPEDFPLDTEYVAAYMAWRKKGPQAHEDEKSDDVDKKFEVSQPLIRQDEISKLDSTSCTD